MKTHSLVTVPQFRRKALATDVARITVHAISKPGLLSRAASGWTCSEARPFIPKWTFLSHAHYCFASGSFAAALASLKILLCRAYDCGGHTWLQLLLVSKMTKYDLTRNTLLLLKNLSNVGRVDISAEMWCKVVEVVLNIRGRLLECYI